MFLSLYFPTFVKENLKLLIKMKKATILGAIAGDVIGSVYEFRSTRNYNFEIFRDNMRPTDDTMMTLAVAEYPHAGYGGGFRRWLADENAGPYNSWGNGSAMRVSPVGFAFDTLEETLRVAKISAEVTHNHPEGIKGAQATAAAIFLARTGSSKEEIRKYITDTFGYDLDRKCADIRLHYRFYVSCQESVPQSICAFMDSVDYESALRETISLGGDADTMGAITGGIACAFYKGMPDWIFDFTLSKLNDDMTQLLNEFDAKFTNI